MPLFIQSEQPPPYMVIPMKYESDIMSQPLTKRTYNILPSRMEYFDNRMKKIKGAADAKIPPIEFNITKGNATTIPLDKILISRAKQNLIPDVRQLPNGDWVRDVIPVTIEYGELGDPDMEYIGRIAYAEVFDTSTGQKKQGFFPDVKKEIGMTDAEYDKRVIEVTPQLEGMAQQFNSYKDLNCDHCSQTGDLKERHFVEIVRATKDHKRWGKGQKFELDLKKGDILQIGSACMQKYSGLDVNTIAAFYELDRAIGAYGPNGSPQNPAGWGYKEMGVWDFAERMIQYYNQREKEWLSARRISLWEVEKPDIIYSKGTLAPLIDRKIDYKKGEDGRQIKPKVETGCFVERSGNRLMRGRQFDMNENDPDKDAQWFFQPFTGDGSVEDMREMWETGLDEAREYMTVPMVNELDGSLEIDPLTGDVMEDVIAVPSTKYIQSKIRKDWRLKIVPIFAPATDSKYVKKTLNGMMNWIKNLTPSGKHGDLQIRIQNTIKLGYVGPKTTNDFTELWRMYMWATFDRRKKIDYKNEVKHFRKIGSEELLQKYPDREWFSFDEDQATYLAQYASQFYEKPAYSWRRTSSEFNKAFSVKYKSVLLSPQQWAEFPAWEKATKEKEEADRKEREARNKYNNIVSDIRYAQRGSWPYPTMKRVKYTTPVEEFFELMTKQTGKDWNALNNPDRYDQASTLFTVIGGNIATAYLTDEQVRMVDDHFRPVPQGMIRNPSNVGPTYIPQGTVPHPHFPHGTPMPVPPGGGAKTVSPPPAPTPSVQPPQKGTPTSKNSRITLAEAKRKKDSARGSSTYQSTVGGLIPLVEGYVVFIPNYTGQMHPDGKHITGWNDYRPEGRLVGLMDMDGNYYLIPHATSSPTQPRVGNYYNLFDVEVAQHKDYNGLHQTVLIDPHTLEPGIEFVDATY